MRVPPVRVAERPAVAAPGLAWLAERIVFEDDRLIVVDKPSGLAVHGGSGLDFGLIEGLRSLRPGLKTLELVHRLDRGTSGCLMVAKKRSALRTLHALLREGAVKKRYLTLVKGRWQLGELAVQEPLRIARQGSARKVKTDPDGKPSVTEFRLVDEYGDFASLLDVEIKTGRTHQIRVHAASVGHPVAGDEQYGDAAFNERCRSLGLRRLFLHAQLIEFVWPETREEFVVSAPLPEELRTLLDALG